MRFDINSILSNKFINIRHWLTHFSQPIRVAKTMTYMLYLIHIEACIYFVVCKYIGVGTDGWVWSGKTLPSVTFYLKRTFKHFSKYFILKNGIKPWSF